MATVPAIVPSLAEGTSAGDKTKKTPSAIAARLIGITTHMNARCNRIFFHLIMTAGGSTNARPIEKRSRTFPTWSATPPLLREAASRPSTSDAVEI